MNILAFLAMLILVITIITLVFGLLAYFFYKIREKHKKEMNKEVIYEDILNELESKYVFFE